MKAIDLHYWIERNSPPHTPEDGVDGIMGGDPNTEIRGIAVTWLPNLDVLKRSAAAGLNFIIAHEPLFYWHPFYYPSGDEFHIPAGDLERKKATPPGRAKQAVIDDASLVVYRLHDGWDQFANFGMGYALADWLGWSKRAVSDRYIYALPPTRLADLAANIAAKLGKRGLRFVGDPDQIVHRVTLDWGSPGAIDILQRAHANGCDAAITGEVVEWRDVEFARDIGVSLITAGHYATETIGMRSFHKWFQAQMAVLQPGLAIEYVDCFDPDHFVVGT